MLDITYKKVYEKLITERAEAILEYVKENGENLLSLKVCRDIPKIRSGNLKKCLRGKILKHFLKFF